MNCRRCGNKGADTTGLCFDCVNVKFNWAEQMARDKDNAAKLGWPEFPPDAPPLNQE